MVEMKSSASGKEYEFENHAGISGLEEAASYITQENYVIVVFSDSLPDELLHLYREHGLHNTVAIKDVFTDIQVKKLLSYTNNIVFVWHSEDEDKSDLMARDAESLIYSLGGNITGFIDSSLTAVLQRLKAARSSTSIKDDSEEYHKMNEADLGYVEVCFSSYKNIYIKDLLKNNLNRRFRKGDILKIKDPTSENMYQHSQPILYLKSGQFPCLSIGKSGGLIEQWINPEHLALYDGFKENLHYLQLKALSDKLLGIIDDQEMRSIAGTKLADDFNTFELGEQ